ncbi:MAG TPA: hypothetical protein VK530_03045 [Candidatus Acidoferrum sp.]|nr:hypothetical protein [Candidatus Acidoferrum sp.]
MSPNQQLQFYIKRGWAPCAKANNWGTLKALQLPVRDHVNPLDQELLNQVRTYAEQISRKQFRGVKPDDFRHACHIVAIGKNKSSWDMTNDECERVVCLFRVLTTPDDIDVVLDWEDPMRAKKRNLMAAVKQKAPIAYWGKISEDKYGTRDLTALTVYQLTQLCMTLNNRKEMWRAPVQPRHEFAGESNQPF